MIYIQNLFNKIHKLKFSNNSEKIRFLIYGTINTLTTNIILQFFLLISSVPTATFISQGSNLLIGFFLYGKRVFKIKVLSKNKLLLYFFLAIVSWQINAFLILFLSSKIELSNNLSAILILPILAVWSYLMQKIFIFNEN